MNYAALLGLVLGAVGFLLNLGWMLDDHDRRSRVGWLFFYALVVTINCITFYYSVNP